MELSFAPVKKEEAKRLNPVTLAFLGDAVYSLFVRETLVKKTSGKAFELQKAAAKIVSAVGQSEFFARIESVLSEEETEIYRRGRNAKKGAKAKHASVADYNRSTGFEAVLGYLWLIGEKERIAFLLGQDDETRYVAVKNAEGLKP